MAETLDPVKQKADLLDSLLEKDPEVRDQTLKALSKLHPERVLPEVRADQKIEKVYERAKTDAIKEMEDKLKERDFKAAIEAEKHQAQKKFDLNEEEMKRVESLMADKKIASYESAADYFRLQTKPPSPTPSTLTDHSFTMPDRKEMKELWDNPQQYRLKMLRQSLAEIEANRNK